VGIFEIGGQALFQFRRHRMLEVSERLGLSSYEGEEKDGLCKIQAIS